MTKTDQQPKKDVEDELGADPKINAALIGVTVSEGAVSLLGTVDTFGEKKAAEDATKRVAGVRAVAEDLTVKLLTDHKRSDPELAAAIQSALKWDVFVPRTVTASVQRGAVTLEGEVEWHYQRAAAERAVRNWAGVVSIQNAITLKREVVEQVVREKVQEALLRQAALDAKNIDIQILGNRVTLTGHASTWQSIENAKHAAWSVAGVDEVVERVVRQ